MRLVGFMQILIAAFAAFAAAGLGAARAQDASAAFEIADYIQTTAEYAVIMDFDTGAVLYEKNGDAPAPPSSMSKLMTTMMLFEKLKSGQYDLDDQFYVSEKAWRKGGSKMWVLVDSRTPIEALLRGVIVQSGNDAAIVIAEALGGTEEAFADMMNLKARELGMSNSHFANATGWPDPEHYMSARDIAILARHIIQEYPEYYGYFGEREFTWSDITQQNRNPVLASVAGADGLKTGHTEGAGYGIVASARRGDARRIIVLNGLESERARAEEARRMLELAFNDFTRVKVFEAGEIVGDAKVWMGASDKVSLRVDQDAEVLVHRLARKNLKASILYEGPTPAAIREGDQIGALRLEGPGLDPQLLPLYAAETVGELGFLGKVVFSLDRLIFGDAAPGSTAEAAPDAK